MTLLQLEVGQFRCIGQAKIELDSRSNLIMGANASGKTSLLEAFYLLGSGHSFRSNQTEHLIQRGKDNFLVVGRLQGKQGMEIIGMRGWVNRKEARVNGEPVKSLAELAIRFPVQVIDPEVHRLLEEGASRRRQFLDWGVFHVEHQFHEAWRRYQRALKQRNAALKTNQPIKMARLWDQELIEQGSLVADFRDRYLAELRPHIQYLGQQLLGLDVDAEHSQGWKRQLRLAEALESNWARDQQRGMSCVGPHRADLHIKVAQQPAKDRVSRGQQKLLACVLILAQQAHRAAIGAPPAGLLLDDPAAELDVDNLGKLLAAVVEIPAQLVVTGLDQQVLKFLPQSRMFHVEHGRVQAMA